jgi:hypothetical protein
LQDANNKAAELEKKHGGPGAGYPGLGGFGFIPTGAIGGGSPGTNPTPLPPDTTIKLPKTVDVVFCMHYHPSGKEETDQSRIGIYFTDRPGRRIPDVLLMGVVNLEIPPNAKNHRDEALFVAPTDVECTAIWPHMHLIGKEVRVTAEEPNGQKRSLLWVKDWDFNWQMTYTYAKPFRLAKGTKLKAEFTWDNSDANPANPHQPARWVRNGENSTDEMGGIILNVVMDRWEDQLALWGANIGHMVDMSLRPAAKPK